MVDRRTVRSMEIDRRRAAWPQIAEEIRRRVKSGTYPAGSAVPSTVALSAEFGVSTSTMRRALVRLIEEGTLWAEPGMGTYVNDEEPPTQEG
jgi:DNA-binding GntR family transcriptional regulator